MPMSAQWLNTMAPKRVPKRRARALLDSASEECAALLCSKVFFQNTIGVYIDLYTYIVVQRDRIWIFGKDDGTLFQDEGDETDFGMKGPSADL